jgi:hypothetical protein
MRHIATVGTTHPLPHETPQKVAAQITKRRFEIGRLEYVRLLLRDALILCYK